MTSRVEAEKSVGCLKTAGFLMHSFAKLTGVLKSAFRLWSNSSPRVRLAGRGEKFGVKQQKSLGLPRLFEQQLAERQRLAAPPLHSFAELTGVLKSAFRLWSNSSPRVRLAGRGEKFGVKQQKSLGLPRLFEQQLAERQRFELWEDSHPRRFSRPLH